ncbi:MAG: 1,4-dihydroxy-2-naphthoate polyprenyltransferase [Actinomycetota bacterium]|nr:1,4-dihydroxy-2-naphthoate polyprenyltransferase [Actinomycetota bacterium]
MISSKLKIWILGIRPKTLAAGICPVLMGLAVAFYDNLYILDWLTAVLTFFAAILIQAGTNLSNDLFDYIKGADNKKRVGPLRIMQSGLVTKKEMLWAIFIVFFLATVCGVFLVLRGGLPILIIGIISIICGFLYTAGPKPIGYMGLGELFVLVFFGIVAFAGTYYIQTLVFFPMLIVMGLIPGFFSVAILSANNLRDIRTDKEAGKNTLAVIFGYRFAVFEYVFCMIAPYLILAVTVPILKNHYLSLLSLTSILFAVKPIKIVLDKKNHQPEYLISVLEKTGQVMLIFSIIFCITWNIRI